MKDRPSRSPCNQRHSFAALHRHSNSRSLRFEQLEDRRTLSATAVTSTIDANSGIQATATNLLGVNLANWNAQLGTAETAQLTESAGLNLFRFPGGAIADDVHFNVASGITIPQFAQFVSSVNGTGMMTVDYGSGSPQEAAAELAYLQGSPSDTTAIGSGLEWNDSTQQWQSFNWGTVGYWASLRAASPLATDDGSNFLRIDQAAPFSNINDWEIGNEEYGSAEIDHHGTPGPGGVSTGAAHDAATYAAFSAQFNTLAAEITGTAGLPAVSIGVDSDDPTGQSDGNWTENVLTDELADGLVPGFISDHTYAQSPGTESDSNLLDGTVTNPSSLFDWSTRYAAYESIIQQVEGAQASSVSVMATEYNSVSTSPGKQSTSLVNGLYVAESIGGLLDSGYSAAIIWDWNDNEQTGGNDSSSLYGWREFGDYGLVGNAFETSLPAAGLYVPFPSYFGVQLASKIDIAGGTVVTATSSNSDLNVYAVKEANGHLDLLVVNTSPTNAATDTFTTTGFTPGTSAQIWQYGEAQDTAQEATTTGASALASSTVKLTVGGAGFSYSFPAYSMTVIDLPPISVTLSGTTNTYTVGATAAVVDSGVTVTSGDADITGATVTISSGTLNTGDTLHFTNQNGINGNYAGGVLTLTGSATVAQYQTALRSITFTTTSMSTTPRAISIVALDGGLTSNTAAATVKVVLAGPSVMNATTTANRQTTSGLVIAPGINDNWATYFQITYVTGGTLYLNNGTTPIANGSFITLAQGEAGLRFTPTSAALVAGGFSVRESTTAATSGLSGVTARAAIAVTLSGPKLTGATTTATTQTTSGLVITPGTSDNWATYFQITYVTGGTLYLNNGSTPIANGSFITLAQGEAGLRFTPTSAALVAGGFTVRESTTAATSGLSGPTARAAIAVTLSGPKVTGATTTANTQTASGLVITPGTRDSIAAYLQITYVTGGTLYLNNGTTPIANGTFITLAQGEAGLRFTPTSAALVAGGFTVRESTTGATSGLSGPTTRAAISVTLAGPSVTDAMTTENTQTTSGLVITPGPSDSMAAYFEITYITGGLLYQNDGTTPIANGSFITLAQGEAGLSFAPNAGSLVAGGFTVRESTTSAAGGLSGPTARAAINVTLASTPATVADSALIIKSVSTTASLTASTTLLSRTTKNQATDAAVSEFDMVALFV